MDMRSRRPAPQVELLTAEETTLSESDKKRRIWTVYLIGFIVSDSACVEKSIQCHHAIACMYICWYRLQT